MLTWLPNKKIQVIFDHYTGFEGYPEYRFIIVSAEEATIFRMWDGWFDGIMREMEFRDTQRTTFVHLYHTHQGWFEASPWQFQEVKTAISQLQDACKKLPPGQNQTIANQLIEFLSSGYEQGAKIFIEYD